MFFYKHIKFRNEIAELHFHFLEVLMGLIQIFN